MKFLYAGKIKQFRLSFQLLVGRVLELTVCRKSLTTEIFLQIWKQVVITWYQIKKMW